MAALSKKPARAGWLGVWFLLLAQPAWGQSLPPGRVLPLAVQRGRCECVLPTTSKQEKFYLVLGSLARGARACRVTVRAEASTDPVSLPLEKPTADEAWQTRVRELDRRLARARRQHSPAAAYQPIADPPRRKVFSIFTKDRDFDSPESYATVTAELRAVGRHCQVYVDRDEKDVERLQPAVDDAVRTFDDDVYPRACKVLGEALDVDRDGRFTILFTGWLGKLVDGRVALSGFVRGSDFYRDLPAPYGNRCDMLYLNSDVKAGPYLHTLLAHEYTHAVVFSEHVFGGYLPEVPRRDEENWLNEALAHLAEDLHGYTWDNLDYRVSAFLSAPERYPLVVPDYYRAGLWRSHGNRGATYLFLRCCADAADPDFPSRLTRTSLSGVLNLEVATQRPFAELFRQWSAAVVLSGAGLDATEKAHVDLHRPLGGRLLCGPRYRELTLAGGHQDVKVAGTALALLLLHSPTGDRARVTVEADDPELQVSLIRLPAHSARLSLRHEILAEPKGAARLLLTAHDADVTLRAAAWERLVPTDNHPADTSYRPGQSEAATIRAWFGNPVLRAGETRSSTALVLPLADGKADPFVFKIAATDSAGHAATAWDEIAGP